MLSIQALSKYDFEFNANLSTRFPYQKEINLRAFDPTFVCDKMPFLPPKTSVSYSKIESK